MHKSFFKKLSKMCTKNQNKYLHGVVDLNLSDKEIADLYGVTPSAVYQWKKGLIEKARRLDYND
ncbi:helix-turn-helix domain-containing protein [Limosilactobacillus sp.]|uniref:helix-turn-helix domain-containing protein n=1 Tax=Limosilactobacillus sp. TaxID=2773925 RepID=UPI0030C67702